jgi:hypothetical protein
MGILEKIKPNYFAFFLGILSFLTFVYIHPGDSLLKVIFSDPMGYYQYLPAVFIDHNLKDMEYTVPLENGNMLSVFHIGVAILQLPFFLISHLIVLISGGEANGYSAVYMYGVGAAASFYLAVGVYFLQKFLVNFYTKSHVLIALLIAVFGTNLFYYSAFQAGMSHVYSFAVFAFVICLSHLFFKKTSFRLAALIGFLVGIIIVIKPNNGIIVFFLIFYGLTSFSEVFQRINWWLKQWKFVLVMFCFGGVVLFLQMAYFKHVSGNWLEFSYGHLGQQFFWTKAQMGKVLFSPQNGFFIYAPAMLFAVIGLIWGSFRKQSNFFTALFIWCLSWYIFASWWCWWFGGAYGHRAFIEYLPLLTIGLTYFIQEISKVTVLKYLGVPIGFALVFVSVRMSFIYASPWDGPDWGWDDYLVQLGHVFWV